MKKMWMAGLLLAAGTAQAAAPAAKPVASAEFTDPAGDLVKMNGPGNDRDVVKLTLGSDGTSILVSPGASQDGSVMITYSADAPFMPRLLYVPGGDHKPGTMISRIKSKCRVGFLVNASPPWGLQTHPAP